MDYDFIVVVRMYTKLTTSLVANANISAHETLFRHWGLLSTAALALTTVSKPSPASERLSGWSFSACPLGDAIIMEASHPCRKKNVQIFETDGREFIHTYPDKAIVEKKPEGGRSSHESLPELGLHGSADEGLNVGACASVEVSSQLSIGRGG